mmetsp:Transcript_21501/g.50132  ORF Transcript_21501/g.50132 Transcript_21501/m.50132 type:complete len:373 (+) Transcript_21501:79-1197(+)
MGCGLVSARGTSVEVHQPLALDGIARATGSRLVVTDENSGAHGTTSTSSGQGTREARLNGSRHEERGSHDDRAHGRGGRGANQGGTEETTSHSRHGQPRRFVMGERVVVASRLPGHAQDHAFCFECGTFFHLGSQRTAQCSRCGSTFVQFLRGGNDHWLSADTAAGLNFTYDDQLDNSISASLEEAPVRKTPTQDKFVNSLPRTTVTEEQVKARQELDAADPKVRCAICREAYCIGSILKQLPCGHEFHDNCVSAWLKAQNTCPICRGRMPEAMEGEEAEAEAEEVEPLKAGPGSARPTSWLGQGEESADTAIPMHQQELVSVPTTVAAGPRQGASGGAVADLDANSSPDMSGMAAEMSVPGTPIPMESTCG